MTSRPSLSSVVESWCLQCCCATQGIDGKRFLEWLDRHSNLLPAPVKQGAAVMQPLFNSGRIGDGLIYSRLVPVGVETAANDTGRRIEKNWRKTCIVSRCRL